jgi:hypothetical protein
MIKQAVIGILVLILGFVLGQAYSGMDDDHSGHHHVSGGHMMHEKLDVSDFSEEPSVDLEVIQNPNSSYNAKITLDNIFFAPDKVGTTHVEGEGHAHIYVDGEKVSRVYGEWFYLGNLNPGERTVMVTLSTNDHRELEKDGELISAMIRVNVE